MGTSDTNKIIVALDKLSSERALELSTALTGKIWGVKVNDLLLSQGASIITRLKETNKVFADPKLYDIPNTVANSVEVLSESGADLITIHASGGQRMIEAALEKKGAAQILAVTALTSFSNEETKACYGEDTRELFIKLSNVAAEAGIDGLVSSAEELEIKPESKNKLLRVTPGIRPDWHGGSDDQRRVNTPKQAIQSGASLLVIGRPITEAKDPVAAVERINQELSGI